MEGEIHFLGEGCDLGREFLREKNAVGWCDTWKSKVLETSTKLVEVTEKLLHKSGSIYQKCNYFEAFKKMNKIQSGRVKFVGYRKILVKVLLFTVFKGSPELFPISEFRARAKECSSSLIS